MIELISFKKMKLDEDSNKLLAAASEGLTPSDSHRDETFKTPHKNVKTKKEEKDKEKDGEVEEESSSASSRRSKTSAEARVAMQTMETRTKNQLAMEELRIASDERKLKQQLDSEERRLQMQLQFQEASQKREMDREAAAAARDERFFNLIRDLVTKK